MSTRSAGSRRSCSPVPVALHELEPAGVGERTQAVLADQSLVHAPKPTAVGGVDGGSERDRLAVHRPSGRHHEVGERNQALRVDRVLGEHHRGQLERAHVLALGVGARQHHRLGALVVAECSSTCGKSGFDLRW